MTPVVIAVAHPLLLSAVSSSVRSHRHELYPDVAACLCDARIGVIVHFISPQNKGRVRHLDISPIAEQRPLSLLVECRETNAANREISTILF